MLIISLGHEFNDVINCYDGKTIENFSVEKFWKGFENIAGKVVLFNAYWVLGFVPVYEGMGIPLYLSLFYLSTQMQGSLVSS